LNPSVPSPPSDLPALRTALQADLRVALKARATEAVSALRTSLAALDNAAAVPVSAQPNARASQHVAGAQAGVGSTEVPRRVLSIDEARGILQAQIDERLAVATEYEANDRGDAAARLRREADVLRRYLPA
jgi:uncharacterized protein YqeY